MTNQRVRTLKNKYGDDFFSRIGRLGYERTCELYFNGDRDKMNVWLMRKGWYVIDQSLQPEIRKPGIFWDPGPHPAHAVENGDDT